MSNGTKEIANTLVTEEGRKPTCNFVCKETGNYIKWEQKGKLEIECRAWKELSPTLHTKSNEVKVALGVDYGASDDFRSPPTKECCSTLLESRSSKGVILINGKEYKIRKLTPKECWRLMGFTDIDFNKAQAVGTSNTQLYKQAGNSIAVNVLEEIFKKLL